jgi:hypothetical protein
LENGQDPRRIPWLRGLILEQTTFSSPRPSVVQIACTTSQDGPSPVPEPVADRPCIHASPSRKLALDPTSQDIPAINRYEVHMPNHRHVVDAAHRLAAPVEVAGYPRL